MKKKIYIADRPTSFRKGLAEFLEKRSFEVSLFSTGPELMEQLEGPEAPDLIFLNVLLPPRGGYELCREIKQAEYWKQIPIVLMGEVLVSQKLQLQARHKFLADQCMVTPTPTSEVDRILRELLEGKSVPTPSQPAKQKRASAAPAKGERRRVRVPIHRRSDDRGGPNRRRPARKRPKGGERAPEAAAPGGEEGAGCSEPVAGGGKPHVRAPHPPPGASSAAPGPAAGGGG
ncbi:MAG: response regulator, partial [Deltaproteobacteria bacterium]